MSRRFLLILAVLFIGFGGFIIYTKQKSNQNGGSVDLAAGSNHVLGTATTGVSIVEFGDFQCPACGQYYPLFKALKEKYGDKISFQFRHFPLVNIHPNAMAAHRASEAASKQNKFWEMHDMLYERQQQWSSSTDASKIFENYATELELNMEQYKKDITNESVSGIINADVKAAQAIDASSTPTIVIGGKKVDKLPQPNDIAAFTKLIDDAIAKK